MALERCIRGEFEYAYGILVGECFTSFRVSHIEVIGVGRAVVAWNQTEHHVAHTEESIEEF